MGRNQYWAGRVYDLCVYYMTGTPKGSTESGFMEKPGIEPATPGLQGIALICIGGQSNPYNNTRKTVSVVIRSVILSFNVFKHYIVVQGPELQWFLKVKDDLS